ncbi:maml-1 domain [Holotrichia oblita]|uniref:Maml-1 domain n=1 Tax=Holotrichia oblita TaxID=644536 RepID=A0ACB9SQ51_HOLOL|nr:maml-1 domain [Holotrichia oblita]
MPRFDQSFNGLCEQNLQETQQLKQRYLDGKNKRVPKTKDKKQQDSIQSSVHVQQKFLKRTVEEHDPGGGGPGNDGYEPPVKLQCTTQHGTHQPEGLTKFSVEIVQQLEFTTSAANSQPQQISTNVTVKAHTNASVKNVGTLVECVKQEPDNDFADLDQCAAALEKDAVAHGGAGFGAFTDLIGDDTNDDTLKDLISDITNCPEFLKEFDFEDKTDVVNALKVEDLKDISSSLDPTNNIHSPLGINQNYSPNPVYENKNRLAYSNIDFGKTELSPAAQTLKQMAEQHQHKNQMGLSYNPNGRTPNSRSPYPDFPLPDYGSPNSNSQFHKSNSTFPQPDMIKQEMMFQTSDFDMKRKTAASGMYKQQYSPYGSPGAAANHGSPGYLPRGNPGGGAGPNGNNFGAGTPPRPPSGPGGNNSTTTLQINQAQQLHISQQSHGHNIQVSAGQHLHLTGDLKGNVSVAAQQGMHFTQHVPSSNTNQQQSQQQSQQSQSQQQQNPHQTSQPNNQQGNQHNNNPNQSQQSQQQQQNGGPNQQHSNNPMLSANQHSNLQSSLGNMNSSNISPGIGVSMHSPGLGNMQNSNSMGGGNGLGTAGMQSGLGGGNTMMGPGGINHGVMPGNHLSGQTSLGDTYSLSQSQTINFTQQSLRQRANSTNGMTNPMGPGNQFGPGGPMNTNNMAPRHLSPQALEHQKLLQQQMLRAQQVQQHVRPPPPDYKTTAGMMQGMQPRYTGVPPNVRRCLQPMPPSGPMMMRPHNMYMMQQQHMTARGVYPRQQTTMSSMDNMPPQGGNNEWRHMLMTQQQSANFNQQMRPNFPQGFNMNSGNMSMSALQHQQLRVQQGMVGNNLGQGLGQGMNQAQVMNQGSPMSQMNTLNQQIMTHMQQQQSVMQQNSNQVIYSLSLSPLKLVLISKHRKKYDYKTKRLFVHEPVKVVLRKSCYDAQCYMKKGSEIPLVLLAKLIKLRIITIITDDVHQYKYEKLKSSDSDTDNKYVFCSKFGYRKLYIILTQFYNPQIIPACCQCGLSISAIVEFGKKNDKSNAKTSNRQSDILRQEFWKHAPCLYYQHHLDEPFLG